MVVPPTARTPIANIANSPKLIRDTIIMAILAVNSFYTVSTLQCLTSRVSRHSWEGSCDTRNRCDTQHTKQDIPVPKVQRPTHQKSRENPPLLPSSPSVDASVPPPLSAKKVLFFDAELDPAEWCSCQRGNRRPAAAIAIQ